MNELIILTEAATPKVTKVAVKEIYPLVEKSMSRNQSVYKKCVQDFIKRDLRIYMIQFR